MILQGMRDKEIAHELDCAVSTISNTVSRIYKKTKTGSRVELIRLIGNINLPADNNQ
jgi:DNA-binding NarL/FixJ family response regulator